ncbi:YeeE/YedE family protein [Candidatus Agathobaculum pullicola]|uniref:YeeE/YedE family protein n=1 Tax=Candidatus Agathobaculum pullicola TaxID=2838426 RepID=UPI003F8E4246
MNSNTIHKPQFFAGVVVLVATLLLGATFLGSEMLFFRMLVGLGLGYALMRSAMGFAGSANRAYNTGSTKLLRTLMFLFFISAVISGALTFVSGADAYGLWINQINLGLLLGGLMFGTGMAFCMCCASGVLTDMIEGPSRAILTLIFFGIGVYVGFPLQATQSWVTDTWFHTESYASGVYLPDLFTGDGLNGYLGALILTGVLCLLVCAGAKWYENKRRRENTYTGVPSEREQETAQVAALQDTSTAPVLSQNTLYRLFVKPWTLTMGAVVILLLFSCLMIVTKGGWGASTPYGHWFGRILLLFGVSIDSITAFTHQGAESFTAPFFSNAMNVQNVCIILGALVASLTMGKFTHQFREGLKISFKEVPVYIIGGLLMGIGTRLANGCNVGALYTPIANLSLSGWIYFVFLFSGGILGNIIKKRYFACCNK